MLPVFVMPRYEASMLVHVHHMGVFARSKAWLCAVAATKQSHGMRAYSC